MFLQHVYCMQLIQSCIKKNYRGWQTVYMIECSLWFDLTWFDLSLDLLSLNNNRVLLNAIECLFLYINVIEYDGNVSWLMVGSVFENCRPKAKCDLRRHFRFRLDFRDWILVFWFIIKQQILQDCVGNCTLKFTLKNLALQSCTLDKLGSFCPSGKNYFHFWLILHDTNL